MEDASCLPMEDLLAVELWAGIFSWLTSARDLCAVACVCRTGHALVAGPQSLRLWRALALRRRWPEDTSINQPQDFRRELVDRVRRSVPEYGPPNVDLSTTSLQFTTSFDQPGAGAAGDLRTGKLEDILRFIFQQRSFVAEIEIVLHNYSSQFTDEELLDAVVKAAFPFSTQSPSGEWWAVWRHSLAVSKAVCTLVKWIQVSPRSGKSCADRLELMRTHLLGAASPLPFLSAADLQRLVAAAEKFIQRTHLRQQLLQDQEAKDEQRLRHLAEEAAVVAQPPPPLKFVHSAPSDELAAELIHHFLLTEPERLAAALTMRAWDSFASITLNELADQVWTKKMKREKAPNVMRHIEEANRLATVVAASVLVGGECANRSPQERAVVVRHWICVAEAARRLNNYATVKAVMTGLNDASCWRLKQTWKEVKASEEVSQTFSALETLIRRLSGMLCYRQALANAALPCLPFLGFILSDLTFICDGQVAHWPGPGMAPFKKWRLCNNVFTEIRRWQSVPYRLEEQAEVVGHLMRSALFHSVDSGELYALSCTLEPKTK